MRCGTQVQNIFLLAVIFKSPLTQAKTNKILLNARAILIKVTTATSLKLPFVLKLNFCNRKETVYFSTGLCRGVSPLLPAVPSFSLQ